MAERLLTRVDPLPERSERLPEGEFVPFRDLDRVRILAAVRGDDGEHVPAGSVGTVVAVWGRGWAYEVEFAEPVDALATIEMKLLELVERAAD